MKFSNKYIAIDIETTDSDSGKGDIIQIGAVILGEDCSIEADFVTDIKPLTDWRNPEAMRVNEISEERLAIAPPLDHALQMFEEWALQIGRRPMLAAWASYFDVPFLEAAYAKIGRKCPFSYKNLDLKSIAIWEAAKRDIDTSGGLAAFIDRLGLTFEGRPHDGLDDIKNSVRIIQTLHEKNT